MQKSVKFKVPNSYALIFAQFVNATSSMKPLKNLKKKKRVSYIGSIDMRTFWGTL